MTHIQKIYHIRKKFPRLKVYSKDINEIWSIDLAYVDKLSKYNDGIMYLFVCVDVLSRYLRVQPMKNKFANTAMTALMKMIKTRTKPQKIWTDKGTEFAGAFSKYCKKMGIHCYSTYSETKSAYAERNIRSLKNIIYKYLEEKNTYRYIDNLQKFVATINARKNRVTVLAPKNVRNL